MELRELLLMGTTAKGATGRDIELQHMKDQTLPRGGSIWTCLASSHSAVGVWVGGAGNSSRPSGTCGGGLGRGFGAEAEREQPTEMFPQLQPTSPEAFSSHPISFLESLTPPSPSNSCLEVLTSLRT